RWVPLYPPLFGHSTIYDPKRDRVILFGGSDNADLTLERGDIWVLPLGEAAGWSMLPSAGFTPKSVAHGAFYDQKRDLMITMCGYHHIPSTDTEGGFEWSLRGNPASALSLSDSAQWSQVADVTGGVGRTVIYDPIGDRGLCATGQGAIIEVPMGNAGPEVWAPTSFPTLGEETSAIYDPMRRRMLMYGGYLDSTLWSLSLTGIRQWLPLAPAGPAPPSMTPFVNVYDPLADRMLSLFGPEVWDLALVGTASWSHLATS